MLYATVSTELKEVADLLQEWTGKQYNQEYAQNSYIIVAKDGDRAVGCTQLIIIGDPFFNRKWGLIENVYVTPLYRNKGVGKMIMDYTWEQATNLGCEFVKLTSSFNKTEAYLLYQSMGYAEGSSFKKVCEK
jgi:GNAT superfamily N-acetyltransferase